MSTTGYVFTLSGLVVSSKGTLQPTVILSTTEAVYMALTEAAKEGIWLKGLVSDLVMLNCAKHCYSVNNSLGVYKVHQDTKTFLFEKKGLTKEDIDEVLCSDKWWDRFGFYGTWVTQVSCALDQFGNKSIMSAASFSALVAGSTYVGLKPIPPKLFQMKDSVAWNRKTVSNGSKTHCMKTWNLIDNKKFETLSYLPPLTDDSIAREIDYMMKKGWIPCLEFDAVK
ncbi:hypothetical protein AgCh_011616 [Apium graveolens]